MLNSSIKIKTILYLGGILLVPGLTAEKARVYQIDTNGSRLEWVGKKITGEHHGTIRILEGMAEFRGNKLKGGKIIIDLASIVNLDIKSSKWRNKLENHLRSEDFFSTDEFPTATFEITGIKPAKTTDSGSFNYSILGILTIKGIARNIEFPAKIFRGNSGWHMEGLMELDRTRWDIKYKSGKFFKNLGDKMIYDQFSLKFSIQTLNETTKGIAD